LLRNGDLARLYTIGLEGLRIAEKGALASAASGSWKSRTGRDFVIGALEEEMR
jgi:hypothetical protein